MNEREAPESPADLLRRAAARLEELNARVDPAPWRTDGIGGVWRGPVGAGHFIADCNGEDEGNAALIVAVRAAVLPLAAVLRFYADSSKRGWRADEMLDLARAILGEPGATS